MQDINTLLTLVDDHLGGSQWFVLLLLGTGIFYTFYLGFPQVRYFGQALRIVRGKYDNAGDRGDLSHFQALSTALSSTVGTGNIAGVAFAIHLGGPSALFWMLMTAFIGMTTKFVEVTLSHKYREVAQDGSFSGGPMYYMKNKLRWPWMAAVFATATIISSFSGGNIVQINNIAHSMRTTFGLSPMLVGGVLSLLLAAIILGGIKRIAQVTEKLVPFMAIVYFIGCMGVILFHLPELPSALWSIFSDVWSGSAATGGFLGASVAFAFNRGVNRGLFSNEAGQGSAPIAHAAARTQEPVSEGMVALLEPFIDTILICSLTGITLLCSGTWKEKMENRFQPADMQLLAGQWEEGIHAPQLSAHLSRQTPLPLFEGALKIEDGKLPADVTLLHARSVAEQVRVLEKDIPFEGNIQVEGGKPQLPAGVYMEGRSLLHSAPLTNLAMQRGFFGGYGQYFSAFSLLLFAFSTIIATSYYGDRAITFLLGSRWVVYYRVCYVVVCFLGAFIDNSIVWTLSGITVAFMTLPNLIGILLLHKDMRESVQSYWAHFKAKREVEAD